MKFHVPLFSLNHHCLSILSHSFMSFCMICAKCQILHESCIIICKWLRKKRKESVDFTCQKCNECMAPSPLFSMHSTTDTVIISCTHARQSSARRVSDPSTFSRNAPQSLPHRRRGSSATGPLPQRAVSPEQTAAFRSQLASLCVK